MLLPLESYLFILLVSESTKCLEDNEKHTAIDHVGKKKDGLFFSGSCVYSIQPNYQSCHISLSVFWIDHISLCVLKFVLQEFRNCSFFTSLKEV